MPPPCPFLLWAPTSRLGVCRAELGSFSGSWRRKCRTALPSTKPHCSQQILPGSGAFFSNDSAAREWEGPSPRLRNVTKASLMGSHWAHMRRGGGWRGWGRGRTRTLGGRGGRLGGSAAAFPCTARSLSSYRSWFSPGGGGWGCKAKGQEMEMGELVSMETGIQWTTTHVCVRMLNGTGQTWHVPRYQAHRQCGLGWACSAAGSPSCTLHPPCSASTPPKHICSEQLSIQASLTLA